VKTIIMIIGAGATGKTTLSRALAGEDAAQRQVDLSITQKGERKRFKAPYVLGPDIAIAGNLKNTSDAIGAMDALHQTIDHCLNERDTVITDGFRCTQKLVRWIEDHPLKPAALFVFIELSLNANLVRLRGRRAGNGTVEHKLPPKTFLNVLRFRERSQGVWSYARHHYTRQPVSFLELSDTATPQYSADLIRHKLANWSVVSPNQ
jgi:adenylate kinase family enzyme